jgi:acyl carrier protein
VTAETAKPSASRPDGETTLTEIAAMLRAILDQSGLDEIEITSGTRFHDDLALESIDLVTLATKLQERYGERVNLAEFVADLGLDEIIALTVGQLIDYVVAALRTVDAS